MVDRLHRFMADVGPIVEEVDHYLSQEPGVRQLSRPLSLVVVARGSAGLRTTEGTVAALSAGSSAIVRGPATVQIVPGAAITSTAQSSEERGVGASELVIAAMDVRTHQPLLHLGYLPEIIVGAPSPLYRFAINALAEEVRGRGLGSSHAVGRLVELLLVATVRSWFDDEDTSTTVPHDLVVDAALRLLNTYPDEPWTVGLLARRVAVSRSTLARRFKAVVGESPMMYLAHRRVCLAAAELEMTDETVDTVARRVGYASSFALSNAFHRVCGVRPTEHRRGRRCVESPVRPADV